MQSLLRPRNKTRNASQRSHTLKYARKVCNEFFEFGPRFWRRAPRSSIKAPFGPPHTKDRRPTPFQGGNLPPAAHSSSFFSASNLTGEKACPAWIGWNTLKSMDAGETGVKASNLSPETGFDVDEIGSIYYVGGSHINLTTLNYSAVSNFI